MDPFDLMKIVWISMFLPGSLHERRMALVDSGQTHVAEQAEVEMGSRIWVIIAWQTQTWAS
jgi:hypothetical protein